MSLIEPFRKLWTKNTCLQEHNNKLLEENKILIEEIKMLKKLLYDIELDLSVKLKKR
jgi:hypothetical protein